MRSEDWPTDLKPQVLANFKRQSPPKREVERKRRREAREGNSDAHLALVRMLPCAVCHKTQGTHPHHLRSGAAAKQRSVGRRAPDKYTVPLCFEHHVGGDGVHSVLSREEPEWFRDRFGIDCHALAEGLWKQTGDWHRMNRMLLWHKEMGSLALLGRR